MQLAGDHNWHLAIAETLHQLERIGICRDIDDFVRNTLTVEGAGGCGALNAGRLAVYPSERDRL
ncbi:hypothetical protein GCM10023069_01120 [Shinella granuli]